MGYISAQCLQMGQLLVPERLLWDGICCPLGQLSWT